MASTSFLDGIVPASYLSWTDTQIRVKVPGDGFLGVNSFKDVGTGPVHVKTNSGAIISIPGTLNVEYNISEYIDRTTDISYRYNQAIYQCKPLIFTLNTNEQMYGCIYILCN